MQIKRKSVQVLNFLSFNEFVTSGELSHIKETKNMKTLNNIKHILILYKFTDIRVYITNVLALWSLKTRE